MSARITRSVVSALATLLLAAAVTSPVAVATATTTQVASTPTQQEGGFTNTTVVGDGVALRTNETVYLWQNNSSRWSLELDPFEPGTYHTICFGIENGTNDSATQVKCRVQDLNRGNRATTFDLGPVVADRLGPQTLNATLTWKSSTARTTTHVTVITRSGDLDGDTLTNAREIRLGTGLNDTDTDTDSLADAPEIDKYGTSPLENDTDGDGLRDAMEIQLGTTPTRKDTDGDGILDGNEVHTYGTSPTSADTDDDGLADRAELEQHGTDPTARDTDSDGLADATEIREYGTIPTQKDTDGDGVTDGREVELNRDPREASLFEKIPQPTGSLLFVVAFLGAAVLTLGGMNRGHVYDWLLDDDDSAEATTAPSPPDDSSPDEDAVDPELLSPEERVLHLIEQNGGRIKQSDIVEYTPWSKAKVSRTLSKMDEKGAIERTRIGRENVVSVPENKPRAP